jgi:hypothetical protein
MPMTPARIARALFARRQQPWRALPILAVFPLVFVGLMGEEDGALVPYCALASICLLSAIYPTLAGWSIWVAVYSAGSAAFLYALIRDLIDLAHGRETEIFAGPGYCSLFFVLFTAWLAADVAFLLHRPKPLPAA